MERLGAPPQIIWLTCGNALNAGLHQRFSNLATQSLLKSFYVKPAIAQNMENTNVKE